MTSLVVGFVLGWFAASVPVGVAVGRWLRE